MFTPIDSILRLKQQEQYIGASFMTISIKSHHLRVLSINIITFRSSLRYFGENANIEQVVQNFKEYILPIDFAIKIHFNI